MGNLIVNCNVEDVSDGFHTFGELYNHRHVLFLALMKSHPDISWKSLLHADGTMFGGMFIAGMELPMGQVTYHIPYYRNWDMLWNITTIDKAPKYDGHTSKMVVVRLESFIRSLALDQI